MLEKDSQDHPYTIIRGWGPPEAPPKQQPPKEEAQPPKQQMAQQQQAPRAIPPAPPVEPKKTPPPDKSRETVFEAGQPAEEPSREKSRLLPIFLVLLGVLALAIIIFFVFFFRPQVQNQGTGIVTTGAAETQSKTDAAALVQKFEQTVKNNSPLYFVPDETLLLAGDQQKLEAIAQAMAGLKKIGLTVTGHTADDNKPVPQSILSRNRAIAVQNYLLERVGKVDLLIETEGKGATEPVVKDLPIDQQEPNRRVEIRVNSVE